VSAISISCDTDVLFITKKEGKITLTKDNNDNHANQLNPNNDAYWESRGYEERPDDWEERSEDE
jgi:hypothetical protein